MNNKKTELNKLQAKWYKKLKATGFDELEYKDGSIKSCAPPSARKTHRAFIFQQSTQEYYYMATHFLNDYKFESTKERNIWEYHANGLSVRSISRIFNKLKFTEGYGKSTIFNIIKRLEADMYKLYAVK